MEGDKQMGSDGSGSSPSSSTSFTTELFGPSDLSSSSAIFGAIFAPNSSKSKVETARKEQNPTLESPDDSSKGKEGRSVTGIESSSVQPCHLSSSIYYGGPDVYSKPQHSHNHNSGVKPAKLKKDGEEDDSESASRGNWWQGSLYY